VVYFRNFLTAFRLSSESHVLMSLTVHLSLGTLGGKLGTPGGKLESGLESWLENGLESGLAFRVACFRVARFRSTFVYFTVAAKTVQFDVLSHVGSVVNPCDL
jgi:hypothetical protein